MIPVICTMCTALVLAYLLLSYIATRLIHEVSALSWNAYYKWAFSDKIMKGVTYKHAGFTVRFDDKPNREDITIMYNPPMYTNEIVDEVDTFLISRYKDDTSLIMILHFREYDQLSDDGENSKHCVELASSTSAPNAVSIDQLYNDAGYEWEPAIRYLKLFKLTMEECELPFEMDTSSSVGKE